MGRLITTAALAQDVPENLAGMFLIDYVIEVVARVDSRAAGLPGMRIVSQPRQLRHLTARFAPLR